MPWRGVGTKISRGRTRGDCGSSASRDSFFLLRSMARKAQVEAFAYAQRSLYADRPRPGDAMEGFGRRTKGESDDTRCLAAEGECMRPRPGPRRALRPMAWGWPSDLERRMQLAKRR
jgi:hypothetical protein